MKMPSVRRTSSRARLSQLRRQRAHDVALQRQRRKTATLGPAYGMQGAEIRTAIDPEEHGFTSMRTALLVRVGLPLRSTNTGATSHKPFRVNSLTVAVSIHVQAIAIQFLLMQPIWTGRDLGGSREDTGLVFLYRHGLDFKPDRQGVRMGIVLPTQPEGTRRTDLIGPPDEIATRKCRK